MSHFVSIAFNSDLYQESLLLRNRLLRKPLGLELTAQQLTGEEEQRHFGLLDNEGLNADSAPEVLVACVIAVPLTATHVKLRQMAVDDSRQRSGLGTRLIQCVEDELRKDGVGSIELNAREPAIGFYERLGYQPEGPRFVEVTIPHQKMVKQLT